MSEIPVSKLFELNAASKQAQLPPLPPDNIWIGNAASQPSPVTVIRDASLDEFGSLTLRQRHSIRLNAILPPGGYAAGDYFQWDAASPVYSFPSTSGVPWAFFPNGAIPNCIIAVPDAGVYAYDLHVNAFDTVNGRTITLQLIDATAVSVLDQTVIYEVEPSFEVTSRQFSGHYYVNQRIAFRVMDLGLNPITNPLEITLSLSSLL